VDADHDALRAILADSTVARWWGTDKPDAALADVAGQDGHVTLVVVVAGVVAGAIMVAEETDPDYRHAGIDIFLASAYQGRGLGSDAIRVLARYLFDERGHHRLTIDPAADNDRAIRAYESVGFRPVGIMRAYERGRDGSFHDGLLMDLLAGELTGEADLDLETPERPRSRPRR
jgi:aminoglycoside 6'-N-acetyltransferase